MNIKNLIGPLFIIVAAVLIRLLPHPANFAPVAAMALFGGAYLNRKYSLLIVFGTLILSDYLLLYIDPFSSQLFNFSKIYSPVALLHNSSLLVYLSFLLTVLIGMWLKEHKSFKNVLTATLGSSILFFLITNFNYLYMPPLYPRTIDGAIQSYIMAIPFFKYTVLGDLFYTGLFFGGFEVVSSLLKRRNYGYLHEKRG